MTIASLAWAGVAGAADVRLQVVSQEAHTSPPTAMADPCRVSGESENPSSFSSTHVSIGSAARGSVQGVDCDSSSNNTATQSITATLTGAPGATTPICYVVRFAAATSASGPPNNVDAIAQVGGVPPANPGGVFLNNNALATFQANFLPNQANSDTQRALFTATVGDVIRLDTGAAAFAALTGAGSARSDAEASAAIYIGACPVEHAPAASPWGLLGLVATLAALGTAVTKR
ncbi:hypothetical protein KF840_17945 [bacterium]|nr:hypothetical protein [bacterium]